MEIRKEKVTPKKAAEWLQRNVHNRPLSQANVSRYASAMGSGEWKMNGDPVRFNGNGDLIDGQHRLHACIKSGVTFESVVIRGLDHDAFDTIDQGKLRQLGDVLARRGEKHYSTLAAAIRVVWRFRNGFTKSKGDLRPPQADAILAANPGLRGSVEFIRKHMGTDTLLPVGLAAGLHHEFSRASVDAAGQFWLRVMVGEELTRTMPEFMLRKVLLENRTATAKFRSDTIAAFAIKAWNATRAGEPLKLLRWTEREDFPVISKR